ncbi:MAG: amidohydrolase family protein [Candidatus Methanoperedens sp.]|nr:amidohydrolase family protein [Candidatus Methanoperedens sp.]
MFKKLWIFIILGLLTIGIVFISGCVQEKGPTQPNETAALQSETEAPNTSPSIASLTTTSLAVSTPLQAQNGTQPTQISTPSPTPAVKFEGRYIDVHTHIEPGQMSLTQIIQNMDNEGIDRMVIMNVPASLNPNQAEYGIPDAAKQYPDRFVALYGGEAIAMLESAATSGSYTKADEEKYINLLEKEMRSGSYRGFGEIGLRHFVPAKASNAANQTIPGDHPWMFIMSDIAAKYNVPIDIHMEATDDTIRGFESLLDHNKSTKIIWDHAGWSNTGKATPQLIRQLMEKHPNLYTSIKIIKEKVSSAAYIFDNDGTITPEWMALFKDYPDRFMIGSDIKLGVREGEISYVKDQRKVLSQLPPEILKKIERENAEKIFRMN